MEIFGIISLAIGMGLLIFFDIKNLLTKNEKAFRRYAIEKNEFLDEISYDKLNVKLQIFTDVAILFSIILFVTNIINSTQTILSLIVIYLLKWSIKPISLLKGYVKKST